MPMKFLLGGGINNFGGRAVAPPFVVLPHLGQFPYQMTQKP